MLLWSLATPLGAVPDEPAHAVRAAAVVRGQVTSGPWSQDPRFAEVNVPNYVRHMEALTCYAFHPEVSAGCMRPVTGDPNAIVSTGTSAAVNSPAYYAIVGLPTLVMHGTPALYAMRGVSAVLCAAALAIMIMMLMQLQRWRWALVATTVGVTPMVLFLCGAINPNGLEIASAGALLATLTVTFRLPTSGWILWERAALVVLSSGLLVSTRNIALLWVVVIIAASLLLADMSLVRRLLRKPAAWVALAVSAAILGLTLAWYAHPPQLATQVYAGTNTNPAVAFVNMLINTFDYSNGYVGLFGWVDTPSPLFSTIAWSAAIVALLVAVFIWGSRRGRLVVLGLSVVLVLVPPIVQALVISQMGYIWQGRYMLAMLVCLLVACGIAIDDARGDALVLPLRRVLAVGLTLLVVGQVFSFWWALRRYVVSVNGGIRDMLVAPQWQPPLGWITLTALLAIVTALGAWLVFRVIVRAEPALVTAPKNDAIAASLADL
ncbi:MAG TPA: DUF2142 domain-containing protein [Microbacteriaceae bacterium]|nr:DUF2142 domain-containing protein [Microbacteriaceae bacterium]